MASSGRSLDHESINRAIRLLQHGCCQGIGGDDRDELWPGQWRKIVAHELPRRKDHGSVVVILCPCDLQEIGCGFVICEAIEYAGNLEWHSCPHQHVSHACEHSAVDGRQMRQLNFFQVVDSHRIVVACTREKDFNKIGHDAKLL